jgi:hypothetical protein
MTDPATDTTTVELAVNGTLMRGYELNRNLTELGCEFVREAQTAPVYRLWSIAGRHPGMIRTTAGDGAPIAVEVWRVPLAGVAAVLLREPPGLSIGKIELDDGTETLGVLAEPALVEGHPEITHLGGWRAFTHADESGVST